MCVTDLVNQLREVAAEHGYDFELVETDGAGEWPYTLRIVLEQFQFVPCVVIGVRGDQGEQLLDGDD